MLAVEFQSLNIEHIGRGDCIEIRPALDTSYSSSELYRPPKSGCPQFSIGKVYRIWRSPVKFREEDVIRQFVLKVLESQTNRAVN